VSLQTGFNQGEAAINDSGIGLQVKNRLVSVTDEEARVTAAASS